jgi:type IV pilus assembly protein PilC
MNDPVATTTNRPKTTGQNESAAGTSVTPRKGLNASPVWTHLDLQKVSINELILFTTQLSVMLASGVVLSDALDAISDQTKPSPFKMIISDVSERIKSGDSFSAALMAYPKAFNPMFISMVRASEASGRTAEMLEVLNDYLTFESETRKQVKSAMLYPFVMMFMAIGATGTLMFFVLPRFMRIYEARGAALPKLTQMLVHFSKLLGNLQAMTTILTVVILFVAGVYFWSRTMSGRKILDGLKLRSPVLGTMFVDTLVTRSMRIMATMVNTGVSLLEAIEVTRNLCDNCYFQNLWAVTDEKIRAGYQLSESISLSPHGRLIAPAIIQMLRAGEKSGRLGHVCDKISILYSKKLQSSIKSVTALIEPVMIVIMGAIIGTIAIALLLPVFRISSVIAH